MAHPLGALYDTPHGVANAIILPTVMEYNAPATGTKYKDIAEAMGVDTTGMDQEAYRKAVRRHNSCRMPCRFLWCNMRCQKACAYALHHSLRKHEIC